jgi:hypothetical protein
MRTAVARPLGSRPVKAAGARRAGRALARRAARRAAALGVAALLVAVVEAPARAESPEDALRPAPVELPTDAATNEPATPLVPSEAEARSMVARRPARPVLDDLASSAPDHGKILRSVVPLVTDLDLELAVFALAALSRHTEPTGHEGRSPFDVVGGGGGGGFEVVARPRVFSSGHVRVSYRTARTRLPDAAATLAEHDFRVVAGAPLALGALTLRPEVGFERTSFDTSRASSIASRITARASRSASLGAWLELPFSRALTADLELHGLFGAPDIAGGAVTLGARVDVALRIALGRELAIVTRWESRAHRVGDGELSKSGAVVDTVLTRVEHTLSVGAVFAI